MPTVSARLLTSQGVVGNNLPVPVKDFGPMSFRVVANAIAPAQDKYMVTLFNANTDYNVEVHRIYLVHNNITAATGVVLAQTLIRISAYTAAAAITPLAMDPADTLPSSITADTGSTSVSDVSASTYLNIVGVSEEAVVAGTDPWIGARAKDPLGNPIFLSGNGIKPIVLRGATAAHKGLAIKNSTNSTAGSCSYYIDFNVVPI
jgi:hypothetical protein